MPDEATEAPGVEETPDTPSTPEETPETSASDGQSQDESVDWAKRYNDLRPEFDRTTQRLSQYEQVVNALQDPDLRDDALSALGIELDEEAEEYDDPVDAMNSKFSALEQKLAEQEETRESERYEQAEEKFIAQGLDGIAKRENAEISETQRELISQLATRDDFRLDDGEPDLDRAYKTLNGFAKEVREGHLKTKKAPRIPDGQSGERTVNLDNEEEDLDWMVEIFEASTAE